MLTIESAPTEALPDLAPQLGDELGDEVLLTAANKPAVKVKAGLRSRAASQPHNPRAWTASGTVD